MSGVAPRRGEQVLLVQGATIGATTYSSDDYWLPDGGGLLVTLVVTDVTGGAIITTLNIQAKTGSGYDTVAQFGSLAINAAGRYLFRMAPGASRAAGASAYKGAVEDTSPTQGRIQVVGSVATATFDLHVGCLAA